jgi:1,5-anhydro-D-fructose reductase (1,5-anhydro-D-mannitol-forming)
VPEPLSVAILGCWHVHAIDYANSIANHPDTVLTAVWDPDEERGRAGAEQFGVEFVADLDALLARPDLDGVSVTTATTEHRDVMVAAAKAGKHIFTEKLLAPTVVESEEILDAASANNVMLTVALPRLYEATTVTALELLAAGKLGTLTYTRVRLAHDGAIGGWLPDQFFNAAEAVGGALSDLGCHPLYLTQLFLGARPTRLTSTFSSVTGRGVEDNAVVTLAYDNGAIGVAETSFVTIPGAFAFELRGTEGSILFGFGGERMLAKGDHFDPDSWSEIDLRNGALDPFERWVESIRSGQPDTENHRAAVELTRIVVAANEAALTGAVVDL